MQVPNTIKRKGCFDYRDTAMFYFHAMSLISSTISKTRTLGMKISLFRITLNQFSKHNYHMQINPFADFFADSCIVLLTR